MEKAERKKTWTGILARMLLVCLLANMLAITGYGAETEEEDGVFLLIGYDQQEGEGNPRSDTMILCRFDKENEKLVLVSLLRDLYVSIPGHGSNRLNAAYAMGGAPLLKQTIAHNFRIPVEAFVEVDFSRFAGIVDLLGGVELDLREDEAALISRETGTDLEPGKQRLTGRQTLCYARIRCLDRDGDFSRTRRQREVLGALWGSYKSCSLPTLVRVMGSLVPMVRTDMASGALLKTAVDVFPSLSQMQLQSCSIPTQGSCVDRTVDGMAVLMADMETVRQQLREYLYSENIVS